MLSCPEEIAALHVRASEWLSRKDLADEALEHALAAGEDTFTLQLVAQHRIELINRERWSQLDRWLGMFAGREPCIRQWCIRSENVWYEN